MNATIADIEKFLGLKNIAMVGVSRDPKDFSRNLFRDLQKNGSDMIPVNPAAKEIEGQTCFGSISQIPKKVQGVLVMTSPEKTGEVVREAMNSQPKFIWIYNQKGYNLLNRETIEQCKKSGMSIIAGACPYMFFEDSAWFHRFHGWLLKLSGKYPN
jgi:predicted CoA-binding protein